VEIFCKCMRRDKLSVRRERIVMRGKEKLLGIFNFMFNLNKPLSFNQSINFIPFLTPFHTMSFILRVIFSIFSMC
jgi:hypothetical protein